MTGIADSVTGSNVYQEWQEQQSKQKNIQIPVLQVQDLKWTTAADIKTSIDILYEYTEASAQSSIEWYGRNKNSLAWWSRWLRRLAILSTIIGGLIPFISALLGGIYAQSGLGNLDFGQLGYLFLGFAAGCVAYDKFFGYSSGWIRYITTKMSLEKALAEFRLDWAMSVAKLGNNPPSPDQVQLMIQRLKEFLLLINNHVEKETQSWIAEFKTSFAELEKSAKTDAEASRPGAIEITVTNGMETDDGFTVVMDGMEIRRVHGTKYHIGYVYPGSHRITVTGKIKNEILEASDLVQVNSGETASATLALPVKNAQP
jgi:hypothetical protein